MDQVITFDKSYQLRLEEYLEVFSVYKEITVPEIQKAWAYYLEMSLDPNGWQAIWKIPRLTCESFNIPFPTIVLVYVEDVDLEELTASVKILAVQDDIHLPESQICKLVHLWPTKDQDQSIVLNLQSTANSLDMLRFFYNYVFMPWDYDDEEITDWVNKRLRYRLRLYYDMACCTVPRATADHFSSLITEAKRLQARRELIESKIHLEGSESPNNEHVQTLAEINIQLLQIRSQVEMLENPLMRDALLKQQQKKMSKITRKSNSFWTVLNKTGTPGEYIEFFEKIKLCVPKKVEIRTNLLEVLEERECDDVIILSKGHHQMNYKGLLDECVLRGIHDKDATVLTSTNENIMLDLGNDVHLENLMIEATSAQCGILARNGKVALHNCKIVGDGHSSIHQGIIVLKGAELELDGCEITGFHTGIVGNSESKLILKDCLIRQVNCGIKIYENTTMDAHLSIFNHCKEYGIVVEMENPLSDNANKKGDFGILEFIPTVKIDDLKGKDNGKGNVLISSKKKIQPISNLFSNSSSESGENLQSDEAERMDFFSEDADELNNTIIERIS